jgi:hypothetical protein
VTQHGGYAAVLLFRESVFSLVSQIAFESELIASFNEGGFPGFLQASLWVEAPKPRCSSENGNAIAFCLHLWGAVRAPVSDQSQEERTVDIRETVLVRISFERSNPQLPLSLRFSLGSHRITSFTIVSGGPFSPEGQARIDSFLSEGIADFVVEKLRALNTSSLFTLDALGDLAADPSSRATVGVLDGAVVIGLDVTGAIDGSVTVSTVGDPQAFTDFSGDNEIAVAVNPSCVGLVLSNARAAFKKRAEQQQARLDHFQLTLQEGSIRVDARASDGAGHVSLQMEAVPRLFRRGELQYTFQDENGRTEEVRARDREELWFEATNIELSVESSGWRSWFDNWLTGWAHDLVLAERRTEIASEVDGATTASVRPVLEDFILPGTAGPVIRKRLTDYKCTENALLITTTFRATLFEGELRGPSFYPIEFADQITLRYSVKLPFAVKIDPAMRVRWTLRQRDINEVVFTAVLPMSGGSTIELSEPSIPLSRADAFHLDCFVFRPLGPNVDHVFHQDMIIGRFQSDIVDIRHPYVRWQHDVRVPLVEKTSDGRSVIRSYPVRHRKSALHRTHVEERCKMLQFASTGSVAGSGSQDVGFEYLDELPFPLADIQNHRADLCEFCFFGGPAGIVPLVH